MTRKEIQSALLVAGLYHAPGRKDHPLWIQALEMYKNETKDTDVSLGCGGCINKIKRWLEA